MSNLICPHCRTQVPRGATVCTGCQAEVKYGAANGFFGGALLVAAVVGIEVDKILPGALSVVGWVTGLVVFGGLSVVIQKFYGDRVVFNRVYRTR
ncbi:hypothetical protein PQR66_03260 [Paraburkholderia agricolaris]|uniref:Zinc ribbon domain-containing protein n=1 Tax=Paraburkholderia agricolaris TaxID=2152888 RepID=A0ABW8ZGC3_9BURK